ncbi:MAG TPA: hypothetical protein VKE74_15530 [Gemmataceae bacterium]|nr:hypothetical protein [Gemmataceae bacterium]
MRVRWFLFAPLAVLLTAVVSTAQPPPQPKDGKLVIPFPADATLAPVPALKYQLLPDVREVQPGNQIPAFYKTTMDQNAFYYSKQSIDQREAWLVAPLADLAREKDLVGYGGSGLKQADYAARLETVDWQILNQMRSEGVYLLLPDLQPLRQLASALKVRMRGEVARGEFPAAIHTAQTLFALARAHNEHPTLIGSLVGLAITNIALGAVEEMLQQPGAPNLFWALTDLPTPFIDLRKGMLGERVWLPREYDVLRTAVPVPEAQLKKLADQLDPILQLAAEDRAKKRKTWDSLGKQAADPSAVKAAAERLARAGHKPADLEKLSPVQAVMMADFHQYQVDRDDVAKWVNVPYSQLPESSLTEKGPPGVFGEFAPSGRKVLQAKVRIQQRIELLKVLEGIRAHAAANGGQVPASLDAVMLPLPVDPVTGKPFGYEVKDSLAVLRAIPPDHLKEDVNFNRVYEVSIRK